MHLRTLIKEAKQMEYVNQVVALANAVTAKELAIALLALRLAFLVYMRIKDAKKK